MSAAAFKASPSRNKNVTQLLVDCAENPSLLSYANQWKDHLCKIGGGGGGGAVAVDGASPTTTSRNARAAGTVFGLAFVGSTSNYLAAVTSEGEVVIWSLPTPPATTTSTDDDEDIGDDEEFASSRRRKTQNSIPVAAANTGIGCKSPVLRLEISDSGGALYACKWVDRSIGKNTNNDAGSWLVVSGEVGVVLLDWENDILPLIQEQQEDALNKTPVQQLKRIQFPGKPKAQLKAFPSAFESCIEVNDFVVRGNHVFGAAGDAFGCYKWDIETEKVVANYKEKCNNSYLHTTELLPNSNHLLFGGEDGILSLWDVGTDKSVDRFDLNLALETSSSTQQRRRAKHSSTTTDSNNTATTASSCWISSCKARDEHWWSVAGGATTASGGGFVATFHLSTRSIISTTTTVEVPQQLAFCSDNNRRILLSVANEGFVGHWNNPLSLCDKDGDPKRQQVCCSQASAYAVAVSSPGDDAKRIAVGGVGSLVDIFQEKTQYGMQLSTY